MSSISPLELLKVYAVSRWFSRDYLAISLKSLAFLKASISRRVSAESVRHSNLSWFGILYVFCRRGLLFRSRALDALHILKEVVLDSSTFNPFQNTDAACGCPNDLSWNTATFAFFNCISR